MIIEQVEILRFAGLSGVELSFGDHITVVEGRNGSGKTTVGEFIRYMLYGYADKNDRERFGEDAAGTLTYRIASGERFRLERVKKKYRVISLETNTTLPQFGCEPGEKLLGLPVSLFIRTAYVGQTGGGRVEGGEVAGAIENILFSGDESVSTARALKLLDEGRVQLLHKNKKGGRIFELTGERQALVERLKAAEESNSGVIAKEGMSRELSAKLAANAARAETLKRSLRGWNAAKTLSRFDELHKIGEKLESHKKMRDELYESQTINGFLPSAQYCADLRRLSSELESRERELESCRESLEGARKRYEQSEPVEAAPELKDGERELDDARRGGRIMLIWGVLSAVIGGVMLGAGIFTALVNYYIGIVIAAAGGCLLAAAAVCAVLAVRRMKGADELEDRLDELREDGANAHNLRLGELRDELNGANARLETLLRERDRVKAQLDTELARWNRGELEVTLEDADCYVRAEAALTREIDKKEAALESMSAALADTDEVELRGELSALTVDIPDDNTAAAMQRELDFITKSEPMLRERAHALDKEAAALAAVAESPAAVSDRLEAVESELRALIKRHDALVLAGEQLEAASKELRTTVSPTLSQYASETLSTLTEGEYSTLGVSPELALEYQHDGITRDSSYMSAGTLDIAYISLRLALIRLLCRGEQAPLIFDESFARLDDQRLAAAFKLLEERPGQSIVLTSQSREAGLTSNVVRLQ